MPKQGREGLGELFADLWRELSLIVRLGLFLGLFAGFCVGFFLMQRIPPGEMSGPMMYGPRRIMGLVLLALIGVGGLVGCAVGAVVELAIYGPDTPDNSRRRKPKKKPTRARY
jgi:hypothetical protein